MSRTRVARPDPSGTAGFASPIEKGAAEAVDVLFDFTCFSEFAAGQTLSSISVPAVAGLTLSTNTPGATTEVVDGIAAGKGAVVRISGGTVDTAYVVSARGAFSGGGIREVRARLLVR